ncbi:uncharacterized protein LOC141631375 [Silene latifolia]|uniref:uncharacterized protein LOC141631375 n=1 Tax=Silene latifolia TaxID=37657 RepID=UPI003D772CCC
MMMPGNDSGKCHRSLVRATQSLTHANTAAVSSSRCFFGLSHSALAIEIWQGRKKNLVVDHSEGFCYAWDMWQESCPSPFQLDSDMVFVPVSTGDEDHYSCICINFLSEQIEYLDNRSYEDDLLKLPYGGIARITAYAMGKYMAYKGLDKGKRVEGFPFVNIKFNWQGAGHTANDCGLYVMVHMLLYRGEPFDCTLGTEESNDLMRAEIAATLVLSDINVDREDVLSRVSAFKELKDRELEEVRDKHRSAGNTSGRKRGVGNAGENRLR